MLLPAVWLHGTTPFQQMAQVLETIRLRVQATAGEQSVLCAGATASLRKPLSCGNAQSVTARRVRPLELATKQVVLQLGLATRKQAVLPRGLSTWKQAVQQLAQIHRRARLTAPMPLML
jgi:hypothetical protein